MGSKNNPGKFDCYAQAEPDEPMFVLLGRDKHAATLVWLWAALRELDQEDAAKVLEARECATNMIQWANDHGRSSVGLGQATLVGCFELIRAVNDLVKSPNNSGTDVEIVRRWLAETRIDPEA